MGGGGELRILFVVTFRIKAESPFKPFDFALVLHDCATEQVRTKKPNIFKGI